MFLMRKHRGEMGLSGTLKDLKEDRLRAGDPELWRGGVGIILVPGLL